jgi:hypothetical protein
LEHGLGSAKPGLDGHARAGEDGGHQQDVAATEIFD